MSGYSFMHQETIVTYNRAAQAYAQKFAGIGSRIEDIEKAFQLCGVRDPRVLELGCGDGRDAVEICKRTTQYLGIDASEELIALARKKLPEVRFEVGDIESYVFSSPIDILFAFASLLHVPKQSFGRVLNDVYGTLSEGGVAFLSLKAGKYEDSGVVEDEWGKRYFYYYDELTVKAMAKKYKIVALNHNQRGKTMWMDVLLQKCK
jgi:SAM-dependent methyltransferase